jgi:hypothetical protein
MMLTLVEKNIQDIALTSLILNKRVSLHIVFAIARVSGHEIKRDVIGQHRMKQDSSAQER